MKEIEELKNFDWVARRVEKINNSNKAGFVHKDSRVINPIKINISPDTLKLLKERHN